MHAAASRHHQRLRACPSWSCPPTPAPSTPAKPYHYPQGRREAAPGAASACIHPLPTPRGLWLSPCWEQGSNQRRLNYVPLHGIKFPLCGAEFVSRFTFLNNGTPLVILSKLQSQPIYITSLVICGDSSSHCFRAGKSLCPLAPFAGSGVQGPLGSGLFCAWPCADLYCS